MSNRHSKRNAPLGGPASDKAMARLDIKAPVRIGIAAMLVFALTAAGATATIPIGQSIAIVDLDPVTPQTLMLRHAKGGVVGQVHVAAGAPVKADVSKLEPGQMVVVEWRGQPVYVVNRTESQLEALPGLNGQLKDPESTNQDQQPSYITGVDRSIKPNLLVIVGLCTHLGCAPKFVPEVGVAELGGDGWKGGFFCPCHGSKFDLSGRVFSGVPASANLLVPPSTFEDDKVLVVGVDPEGV